MIIHINGWPGVGKQTVWQERSRPYRFNRLNTSR
jgi:broad-specificity NMP kinase